MQPWQRSTEEVLKGKSEGSQIITTALNNLLTVGVPASLAIKGLGKVNPLIKKFAQIAQKFGYSDEDVVDHMRETRENQPQKRKTLFDKLVGDADLSQLDEGRQKQLRFLAPVIQKLEEKGFDIKSPQVKKVKDKIKQILGGRVGSIDKEAMEMEPQQPMGGQMAAQPQQPGQGQQALMAILQKIQASRGQGG